jgi:uncharacterized protein
MKVSTRSAVAHHWPDVESFLIASEHLQRDLRISMVRLAGSGDGSARPIIVYVLDPSFNFSAAVATADFLGSFARLARGTFPPLLIAGVGYETTDSREVMARRARDLTPTSSTPPPGVQFPPISFGGASDFLAALHEEVRPAIEGRVPGGPSSRILAGHSFGGLFGLYTLFHRPETFDGYILISPSVWWDDSIVLRYERAWSEAHTALPVRLFLGVADGEQASGAGWRNESFPDEAIQAVRQVDNFRELGATLARRSYEGLHLETAILPGEYHLTVFPAAFGQGLRWMVDQFSA